MPFLLFGFLFAALLWMAWAIAWVVVWAVAMLVWPVALLISAVVLARALVRRSQRVSGARTEAAPVRNGAVPNRAFEDYRRETMARLDEESAKFREFLDRLRRSRDKQEFDAFMAGRRGRSAVIEGRAIAIR